MGDHELPGLPAVVPTLPGVGCSSSRADSSPEGETCSAEIQLVVAYRPSLRVRSASGLGST